MKTHSPNPSFVYLKIFIAILLLLTCGTLVIRLFQLFSAKTFDERLYTIALVGEKNIEIVSFSRTNTGERIAKLHIDNPPKKVGNFSLFEKSIVLGVPLSVAVMTDKNSTELFTLSNTIAHVFGKNERGQRIGDIDYFFMYLKSKQVPKDAIEEKRAEFSDIQDRTIDPAQFSALFRNDSVINKKISVSVVNASGVAGIAKKVADMLEVVGYYVISIDSGDIQENTEIQIVDPKDEFIFQHLFATTPFVAKENSLEDIKITIGKRLIKNL